MSLLEVRGLQVAYGGIRAVKGVDFDVGEGELVSLIGANGAGKSSNLRALSGLLAAGGRVTYAGEVLADRPAFARARAGLVMVPEGRGVFPALSVDENLSVGAYSRGAAGDAAVERDRIVDNGIGLHNGLYKTGSRVKGQGARGKKNL